MEPLPLSTSSKESGNKNYREITSALEPHNILTRPENKRFSEIKSLPLVHAQQSQETKNCRETTSALEPHNILTRLARNNKFSEIEPLPLAQARQSQETKIAVKQLLLWSHITY